MPIDTRDYAQGKDTRRYKEWELEKGVSDEEIKEEWLRNLGWLPNKKPLTLMPKTAKSKPAGIPKPLWVALVIAIIFLVVAWLI